MDKTSILTGISNRSKLPVAYIGFAAVVLIGLGLLVGCDSSPASAGRTAETPEGQDMVIATADLGDDAVFYPTSVDGTEVEIIAVKAQDGSVRTALNTCQVCYNSGRGYYVQQGEDLVCQNCGNHFTMDDVGVVDGGCNPVPITSDMRVDSNETTTIASELIESAKPYFESWKR